MDEALRPVHHEDIRVSVIIPFFNEERFLEETVQSVLQQTYTHWEILLIDDGSSDGSTALAKGFATNHPHKIFYVEHEGHANRGLSATRNAGIARARGELIALLDADDVWLPQKLEKQVAIFEQHPQIALLCESSLYWYSWHNAAFKDVEIKVGAPGEKSYAPQQLSLQLYPLGKGAAPCPSGLMIRKKTLLKLGGFEESFTGQNQMYEDQPFLAKFYLNEMVFVSSDCNNKYRQRHGSLVQKVKASGRYDEVRLFFLAWLKAYLDEHRIENGAVRTALHKALRRSRFPYLHRFAGYLKQTLARAGMGK